VNNSIPIIGQRRTQKIDNITLPQPDGSFVEVPAAAVVALAPEVVAAIASGVLMALEARGLIEKDPNAQA
jgi:hypothetical protein